MLQKRYSSSEQFPRTLNFFQKHLREDSACRLEQEYPLVFSVDRQDRIFLAEDQNNICAGLATLEREIEIRKGERARAWFIGSVVTDPSVRNRGLQRGLFAEVEAAAQSESIDFLVLWSNQLAFYEKLGFFLGGLQASWLPVNDKTLCSEISQEVRIQDSRNFHFTEKHFASFSSKSFRVSRSWLEMQNLFKIPQMVVASTERAYALMGKGEDFEKICHEWAGPANEVLMCIEALRRIEPRLRILSPGVLHDIEEFKVANEFEKNYFELRLEYLGLFKLLSSRFQKEKFDPETLEYPFFIWGLDSI